MRQDPRMMKPYIMVGRKSNKGFNTVTTAVKSHMGKRSDVPNTKFTVNVNRINRETFRRKLARACFINVPRLIKNPA